MAVRFRERHAGTATHDPTSLAAALDDLDRIIALWSELQAEAEIPPDLILEESARYFGLSVQDLISPNRSRPLTTARHVAMYLMRECSGQSLVKIGETFGGRDHTTARHGIFKVEKDMRARTATYRQVQDLSRIIRGRARAG